MEISKILNPPAGQGGNQAPEKQGNSGDGKSGNSNQSKQNEWEEKQRKKGMPTEGLNTFRVKKK